MTDHRPQAADQGSATRYRGRFAPTPSGPLHLGSLLTALASWLQARSKGGSWLLRIDDLDRPRCLPGAVTEILRQLDAHGLHWDEAPRYQHEHQSEYQAALERLIARGEVYPCTCTRARLEQASRSGPDGPVYDGHCRRRSLPCHERHALRLRVPDEVLALQDGWQGPQQRNLALEVGDFTLRRSDGCFGYQLACAVDERAQGITEVVRGADLLGSTFRQCLLMLHLGWPLPSYRHGPVLLDPRGRKLSKQNHAAPLQAATAGENLLTCLAHLGQEPPPALRGETPMVVLEWARQHWRPERLSSLA